MLNNPEIYTNDLPETHYFNQEPKPHLRNELKEKFEAILSNSSLFLVLTNPNLECIEYIFNKKHGRYTFDSRYGVGSVCGLEVGMDANVQMQRNYIQALVTDIVSKKLQIEIKADTDNSLVKLMNKARDINTQDKAKALQEYFDSSLESFGSVIWYIRPKRLYDNFRAKLESKEDDIFDSISFICFHNDNTKEFICNDERFSSLNENSSTSDIITLILSLDEDFLVCTVQGIEDIKKTNDLYQEWKKGQEVIGVIEELLRERIELMKEELEEMNGIVRKEMLKRRIEMHTDMSLFVSKELLKNLEKHIKGE